MPTYARDNQRGAPAAPRQLHILLLILPVVVTGYLLSNVESGAPKLWDQAERIGVLRTDITRLKKENETLTQDIRLLTDDPKTIERIARERYGMVKDNESVYMVYPSPPKGKSP
jgi:cell division protein FtsB